MDLDADDKVVLAAYDAAYVFGQACSTFRDQNPYPQIVPLDDMINTLMTELWDRRFSQTEIRTAFEQALGDMGRYAAGEEVRT
jgi:hypothetical protein